MGTKWKRKGDDRRVEGARRVRAKLKSKQTKLKKRNLLPRLDAAKISGLDAGPRARNKNGWQGREEDVDIMEVQRWENRMSPRGNQKSLPPLVLKKVDIDVLRSQTNLRIYGALRALKLGERMVLQEGRPGSKELKRREDSILNEILAFDEAKSEFQRDAALAKKHFEVRFKGREKELDFAAICLQCFWRKAAAKIRVQQARLDIIRRDNETATSFQACFRGMQGRREAARLLMIRRRNEGALTFERLWRGYKGRVRAQERKSYLELCELQRKGSTGFQSLVRMYLVKILVKKWHKESTVIQTTFRKHMAIELAKSRRNAAKRIGEFGVGVVCRLGYLRIQSSILIIQCFLRTCIARKRFYMQLIQQHEYQQRMLEEGAALKIQSLFRGIVGRSIAKGKRLIFESLLDALHGEDMKIVQAHLVKGSHSENVSYMVERYREGLLRWPESVGLLYGRALLALVGEKDDKGAIAFWEQARMVDSNHEAFELIWHVLKIGVESGSSPGMIRLYQGAMIILSRDIDREQEAMDRLEEALNMLEREEEQFERNGYETGKGLHLPLPALLSAKRVASRYLERFQREISSGSFSNKVMENVPRTVSNTAGSLTAWKRGLNFRFVFSYLSTVSLDQENGTRKTARRGTAFPSAINSEKKKSRTGRSSAVQSNEGFSISKKIKTELILEARQIRELVEQLDQRELINHANASVLVEVICKMLILRAKENKLSMQFKQEPFLKLTHIAPATKSFLAVVVTPSNPNSVHPTDLTLTAVDRAIEEEYILKVSQSQVEELFADDLILLANRFRPGWRRNCRPLIGRLVSLLDVEDLEIPKEGEYVLSIDPIWKEDFEATEKRRYSVTSEVGNEPNTKRWYRVGQVIERQGFRFRVRQLREKTPDGSLLFSTKYKGPKEYWITLAEFRLCKLVEIPGSDSKLELVFPRVRISEVPDLKKPLRTHKQKRRLVLRTKERLAEVSSNLSCMKIQSLIRGKVGRSYARKVLLDLCASKIISAWRIHILLPRRRASLAEQYRKCVAATKVQKTWRMCAAQSRANKRLEWCFATTDKSKAYKLLQFTRSRGILGYHAFEAIEKAATAANLDEVLCTLETKYLEQLEDNPFHAEHLCGYWIAFESLRLTDPREKSTVDLNRPSFFLAIDTQIRTQFRRIYMSFFDQAARVYEESPLALVFASIAQRLIFHNVELAREYAGHSLWFGAQVQDSVKTLAIANWRECVLACLHANCAARRVQRRWRQVRETPTQSEKWIVLYRYRVSIAKSRFPARIFLHTLSKLKLAWALHANLAGNMVEIFELYYASLQEVATSSLERDIQCCIGLLSIVASLQGAAGSQQPITTLLFEGENTIGRQKILNRLEESHWQHRLHHDGEQFSRSRSQGFRKVLETPSTNKTMSVARTVNLALFFHHAVGDNEKALATLDQAIRDEPDNLLVLATQEHLLG